MHVIFFIWFHIFYLFFLTLFFSNYSSEKLQNYFNEHIFKLEQDEYASEGIQWSALDFRDNQGCIDLIEKKLGLLALLDEESRFPKGTDLTLLAKFHANHEKNPFYDIQKRMKSHFIVKHFAGEVKKKTMFFPMELIVNLIFFYKVTYDVTSWLYKNRDTLQPDLLLVLQSSSNKFIASLFPDSIGEGAKKITTGGQFKVLLTYI